MWVVYPEHRSGNSSEQFPLISYAHGLLGGGGVDFAGYTALFEQIASWGFVVAATKSCNTGCDPPCSPACQCSCMGSASLLTLNNTWAEHYKVQPQVAQLQTLDWAKNMSSSVPLSSINWTAGAGIAGHSMGGQSTAAANCKACTEKWGVKAAVLHHAASGQVEGHNLGINASVPTAAFTSTGDGIWNETRQIYYAMPSNLPRVYRDEKGWSHLEPVLWPPIENPLLATFTAAWFKIFLSGDKGQFFDMVFGKTLLAPFDKMPE
eukprot:gene11725-320_t